MPELLEQLERDANTDASIRAAAERVARVAIVASRRDRRWGREIAFGATLADVYATVPPTAPGAVVIDRAMVIDRVAKYSAWLSARS